MSNTKKRAAPSSTKSSKKGKQALRPFSSPPTLEHGKYTKEELIATVAKHGYCVILNVFDDETNDAYLQRIYAAYASLSDLKPDGTMVPLGLDPSHPLTLTREKIPPFKGNGIINVPGVAALRVSEDIRADKNVSHVFELWHGTTLLMTSYDRMSLFVPDQPCEGLRAHADANARQPKDAEEERSLQSAMILRGSSVPDQGFVVWPGHHNDVGKWNRNGKAPDGNWCPIPDEYASELGVGLIISAPAKSQIVWLSTTVHGNTTGTRNGNVGRAAVYVSKAPAAKVSAEARAFLVNARIQHTTLGHDVLRPAAQKPGSGRYVNPINHRFGAEHLVDYKNEKDIPVSLMPLVE